MRAFAIDCFRLINSVGVVRIPSWNVFSDFSHNAWFSPKNDRVLHFAHWVCKCLVSSVLNFIKLSLYFPILKNVTKCIPFTLAPSHYIL